MNRQKDTSPKKKLTSEMETKIDDKNINKQFQEYNPTDYLNDILEGKIATLSKAITLVESNSDKHQQLALEIVHRCLPYAGKSIRIGITGIPGVGKSTFIEAFGKYLTHKNHKVAVLTIDPSSHIGKGSILGDKTRMIELSTEPNAFIRPTPAGNSLGGVAHKTRETIILCEAAGFDVILIETVGVGQNEIAVHSLVDFFLLLSLAGTGDELQGIKRGIIEMADGFVFNKDDGNNSSKVRIAKLDLERALHLFPAKENGWSPKVLTCSSLHKIGIEPIWNLIEEYKNHTQKNNTWESKRINQNETWFLETIKSNLIQLFNNNKKINQSLLSYKKQIKSNTITPLKAAHELMEIFTKNFKK
jgi:LAO/AO transport system kinase